MGVLTESRKRCLGLEHRLPFLSPHNLLFDLASESDLSPPPSKKPKIKLDISSPLPTPTPLASLPPPLPAPEVSPIPAGPTLRCFPPAAPLPRPFHGPQRIIKAFGLGSAKSSRCRPQRSSSRAETDSEMSNLVSLYLEAKKSVPFTPLRLGKREEALVFLSASQRFQKDDHGSQEGLGLGQYKRLVKSVEERQLTASDVSLPKVGLPQSPTGILDLTIEVQKVDEPSEFHGASLKMKNTRNAVLESTPEREQKSWIKKGPIYKELYEESIKRYDSKLRRLEVELELTEKKISSFRPAYKELHDALLSLTAEEEDEVYHALHGRNSNEVLVVHKVSNIEITREVLQCLSSNAWLNDEVINLYLELLKERERREPKKFLKCHFFNTFFFKKLIGGRSNYDFKAVRRWTTQKKLGYSLIECDKIFVPIHKEVHWCLAVIDVKNKKFQYLDSLGAVDMKVLRVLAKYFTDEVKDKNDKQIDALSWGQETVNGLPLQQNGWDCGMFMLKYADFYSRGSNLCFSQDNMQYFRKRTVKEILRLRAE